MRTLSQSTLDRIVEETVANPFIYGASFQVSTSDGSLTLSSASGNLEPEARFYIASINKLMLSAVTLRLIRDNELRFTDRIAQYLPADLMDGLHIYQGQDYSGEITVHHLLTQTSGLPCYLIDKRPDGPKVMDGLLQGNDQAWSTEQVVAQVKKMKTRFRPGQPGKARYGNTNFRLLGRILENVIGKSLDTILTDLFEELAMKNTFVFRLGDERPFTAFYVKNAPVSIPQYFASAQYDIISTAQDLMVFLRAFFEGYFYPKESLQALEQWNRIFFPFKYGIGIQKFYTPWLFSPFRPVPDMVGHCGSVGTAAFYIPEKDVFITGTVNQISSPRILFQTLIKIVNQL
ncbi:hypothetical protein GCM10023189_56710 [Nibrella saemangeumensis]|uniref:Beta-lactamase-related domain-containing protein n=1 Tax=Nibrella saemangeumensis TaxID=1084526 RepID=A0ABP8NQ78_9BACT